MFNILLTYIYTTNCKITEQLNWIFKSFINLWTDEKESDFQELAIERIV